MKVTATALRRNVYAILDQVLTTGIPVEIERKGKVLKIVPEQKTSKLDRIPPYPDLWIGDPADLFNGKIDWMKEWREPENLDAMERECAARKKRAAGTLRAKATPTRVSTAKSKPRSAPQ